MLYIHCKEIISPTRQIDDGVILVNGKKIIALDHAKNIDPPFGAKIIDAPSAIACPGFIDWQLNGGYGYDFTQNPESIWEVGSRLAETGVTSFLPTIITAPADVYEKSIRSLQDQRPKNYSGSQPLGYHFEGPFLNPEKKGAHNPAFIRPVTVTETSKWSRKNGVWVVTLAPEMPGAIEIIPLLVQKGVVVSAGHSAATYDQALVAFRAGVTVGTHLFNAMPKLDHRTPGLAAALLLSDDVTVGLIPDGIHVHPAMVKMAWDQKGKSRMAIITDAMAALGMPAGQYQLAGSKVIVDARSVRLEDGTLAGSILRMDTAVKNMVSFTNCSLSDAIYSSTFGVARLIKSPTKGRLKVGGDADIVLLDESVKVLTTIVNGEVIYNSL